MGRVQVTRPPVWFAPHWSTLSLAHWQVGLPRKSQTTHSLVIFSAVWQALSQTELQGRCKEEAELEVKFEASRRKIRRLVKGRRREVASARRAGGGRRWVVVMVTVWARTESGKTAV